MASAELPVDVIVLDLGGRELVSVSVLPHQTCAEIKEQVPYSSGMFPEHITLLWNGENVPETASAADMGLPFGGSCEMRALMNTRGSFIWANQVAIVDGAVRKVQEGEQEFSIFTRSAIASLTHGVRGIKPLPLVAEWYVNFVGVGSNAGVGVATASNALKHTGYVDLFGQDKQSWALCFGDSGGTCMYDGKSLGKVFGAAGDRGPGVRLSVLMRRVDSNLFASCPGDDKEHLLFSDLPLDIKLYAVASTVYGHGLVVISREQPSEEQLSQFASTSVNSLAIV
eukprot:TRINITY_DN5284_c0_g3_i1.p1 TRINITY_DN5284_c0_g3~~TRINITY_DN5284_c0_g3_i1.p1  ORF type:complete len:283 (-),score=23.96 TRINITY_DN5284_c0_g3_i1:147-995(-)